MQLKHNLSYLRKLSLTSILNTLGALLVVLLVVGFMSFNYARSELTETLHSTAVITGASIRGAVLAGEVESTEDLLQNLKFSNNIIDAYIYLPGKENTYASYQNIKHQKKPISTYTEFAMQSRKPIIGSQYVVVSEPIFFENSAIASITMRSTLDILYARYKFIMYLATVAIVLTLLLSLLLWKMTRPYWANPFVRFARSLHMISLENDYSRRLSIEENDEFAGLSRSINDMLEEIETHQVQLITQQVDLEQLVEARTLELTNSNRKLISEVAERAKTENNLLKLSSAVTQAEESVIITDQAGYIEYVNPSFERITGYSAAHAKGKKPSLLKSGSHDEDFFYNLWKTLEAGKIYKGIFINTRPNGDNYHLEQSITPVFNDAKEVINYVATGRDISDRIESEEALQYMAHHDALTGLPNRILLTDRIDHAIQRANRENNEVAVMFIDLDGFKVANDMYGHEAGDIVLKTVASRLRSVVRTQDTVARISGDEFAVVLEGMHSHSHADVGIVARKLLDSLCNPYVLNGREIFCTASIGVALYPSDGKDTRSLLKHSDQAMYKAKRDGKARYSFYSENDASFDSRRMEREQQLIIAIKEKQFVLHYQPLMRADESAVHGVEALIRWEHPIHGLIPPDQFIPLLEDSGKIDEVGAWVLQEACEQLAFWQTEGFEHLTMSVNVSPHQLNDKQFVGNVITALQTTGIDANSLEIEITERMFLAFNDVNLQVLNSLTDLGVRIAVDDFGMGHSSLSYISKLRVNTLKIDRSFIRDMMHNKEDAKIVSALIGLGERLSISVTAEGVETREQLSVLEDLNCHVAQGYLFSKAMPADEFVNWSQGATKQLRVLTDEALLNFVSPS